MKLYPRNLIIKFITPILWHHLPVQKAKALQKFSIIEKDSARQLFQCLQQIPDPQIKADLFQHILEEYFHADLFEGLSQQFSTEHLNYPILERERLISGSSSLNEITSFYAYAHIGESDVNQDFQIYSEGAFDNKTKAIFSRIASDELRHEFGTDDILLKLCQNKKSRYHFFLIKSRLIRLYKIYQSYMRTIGGVFLNVILSLLYLVFGLFLSTIIKKRLNFSNDEQLKILLAQINDNYAIKT
jgi:hypothetical protein